MKDSVRPNESDSIDTVDLEPSAPFKVLGRVDHAQAGAKGEDGRHVYFYMIVSILEVIEGQREQICVPLRDRFPYTRLSGVAGKHLAKPLPGVPWNINLEVGKNYVFWLDLPTEVPRYKMSPSQAPVAVLDAFPEFRAAGTVPVTIHRVEKAPEPAKK